MITCTFERGARAALRHVVVHAIVERDGALPLVQRAPHLSEGGTWGRVRYLATRERRDHTPAVE